MIDRRTFLVTSLAAAVDARTNWIREPVPRLETLNQWLAASEEERQHGVEQCLERIREADPAIHAWVQVSPQQPSGRGKLSGVPFGVKDIIETRGLATEYGSSIYKGRVGTEDAAIVRELRQRGAVLLGKTHTTAFAYFTPAPTRNPRDLEHTPGGSSSGSAAAVAAGMVPVAIGEQTRGSILRPASFCGVTGFKASYGLLPMEGVLPFAKSLDTLGFFTHRAQDMAALWECLGHSLGGPETFAIGVPEPIPEVEPAMLAAFQNALSQLRRAGVLLRQVDISGMLGKLSEASIVVQAYEGARFHQKRYEEYGDRLGAELANLVRDGLKLPTEKYDEAMRYVDGCKTRFSEIFKRTPVILTPAAVGIAPLGLTSTGDPRMNAPWTALGTPAISIPMPVGDSLPLGLQLAADRYQDGRVIRTAVLLERMLASKTQGR